ncbi:YciI family protein [Humibacter sp. RRB41]|uniref:YciI family protein n=1 Tax=Humibacter sp. RRB41 TaxID=2919946 RepID=UPI001FAA204B|nr:YciI family protein [Humibacter sp. RRB41]
MKYMLLLKASTGEESGDGASTVERAAMDAFDERLIRAGVLLAGEALEASATGARVEYSNMSPSVDDGPLARADGSISGFWILQVASRDEAIEWARRVPLKTGRIEVRRVLEPDDVDSSTSPAQREVGSREASAERRTA